MYVTRVKQLLQKLYSRGNKGSRELKNEPLLQGALLQWSTINNY